MKTYILDTNVLLSDSNSIYSFEKNNIVLPLIVIEELDRHKDRQDEVGRNAREVSRKLSNLIQEHKFLNNGIELENGSILKILSTENIESTYKVPIELNPKSGDNIIIAFCKAYQKIEPNLILVSKDTVLRLKGEAMGISCQNYKTGESYSDIQNEVSENNISTKEVLISKEDLSNFYSGKLYLTKETIEQNKLEVNEFIVLKSLTDSGSGLARFVGVDRPLRKINENISTWNLKPKNKEQIFALDLLYDPNIHLVMLTGTSGVGKTILASSAALDQVIGNKIYNKIIITRPIQPLGKDIGALPGSKEEKVAPWLSCFYDNLEFLLNEDQEMAKEKGAKLKKHQEKNSFILEEFFARGIIQIEATTFIRGRSIPNCFFIIDEIQNVGLHELKTILTRAGEGTKIVILGDTSQIDSMNVDKFNNALSIAMKKFKGIEIAGHVELTKGVRSPLATIASQIL